MVVKSESLYCLISRTEAEYIILFLFFHRNWQEKLELSEKRKVEEAEKLKVKQEFFKTKNDHFKVGVLYRVFENPCFHFSKRVFHSKSTTNFPILST